MCTKYILQPLQDFDYKALQGTGSVLLDTSLLAGFTTDIIRSKD